MASIGGGSVLGGDDRALGKKTVEGVGSGSEWGDEDQERPSGRWMTAPQ
jgi:hypothetical protein